MIGIFSHLSQFPILISRSYAFNFLEIFCMQQISFIRRANLDTPSITNSKNNAVSFQKNDFSWGGRKRFRKSVSLMYNKYHFLEFFEEKVQTQLENS